MGIKPNIGLHAIAAIGSSCALILAGCAGAHGPGERVIIGFDTSGSMHRSLSVEASVGSRLAGRLDPDRDTVTLYRVDRRTTEFSDGPAPDSGAALQQRIVTELGKPASRPGTFPSLFWAEAARRAATRTQSVSIVLFSDGDNDDEEISASQAIRAAASDLAANPRIMEVIVCGVSPENRAVLRDEFQPLGARFQLLDLDGPDADRLVSRVAP